MATNRSKSAVEATSVLHVRLEEPQRSRFNDSMRRYAIPQTESMRRLMSFFADAPSSVQRAILAFPSSPEELPMLTREAAEYLARRVAADLPIAVVVGELPLPPAAPRHVPAAAPVSRRS